MPGQGAVTIVKATSIEVCVIFRFPKFSQARSQSERTSRKTGTDALVYEAVFFRHRAFPQSRKSFPPWNLQPAADSAY